MADTFYSRTGKRLFDAACSVVGLTILSPLLAATAVAVRLSSPGPAFFKQTRTGQFDRPFQILKFRSMRPAPPGEGSLLTASGDPRITPIGRWLRKTKLDELPQLWNVLKGDMSLVGPRPEVPLYTSQYSDRQKQILTAKPGITSHSIVVNEEELMAGRDDKEHYYLTVIMPAKLEVDLVYCQDIRFGRDLAIIFKTLFGLAFRTSRSANARNSKASQQVAGS